MRKDRVDDMGLIDFVAESHQGVASAVAAGDYQLAAKIFRLSARFAWASAAGESRAKISAIWMQATITFAAMLADLKSAAEHLRHAAKLAMIRLHFGKKP
jgi:hypothetical protein